jgi:hypothetical protein
MTVAVLVLYKSSYDYFCKLKGCTHLMKIKHYFNLFPGITGTVAVNEIGDRKADFDLFDMSSDETWAVIVNFLNTDKFVLNTTLEK